MAEPTGRAAFVLRGALLSVALVLLTLAAARPKGAPGEMIDAERSADILLALDVSNSMRTRDMNGEARLEAAKRLLKGFVDENDSDRLALLVFAGSADVLCPFTLDHGAVATAIDEADYHSVARQGTRFGTALHVALPCFVEQEGVGRAIILVSDGEDQGSDPMSVAREAQQRGVVVYTVGVGTEQGDTIPMASDFIGNPIVKKFQGKPVISRLDEATLRGIADLTGGRYYRADTPGRLRAILGAIDGLGRRAAAQRLIERRQDVFTWYLLPALLLLGAEPLMRGRPTRRRKSPRRGPAALLLLLALPFLGGWAWPWTLRRADEDGRAAYAKGDYTGAATTYSAAMREAGERPELLSALGASQVAQGDFLGAADTLGKVQGGDPKVEAQAAYNRGNALFRLGQYADAAESYRRTLQLDPNDGDAQFNLGLCQQRLTPPTPPASGSGAKGGDQGGRPSPGAATGEGAPSAGHDESGQPRQGEQTGPQQSLADIDAKLRALEHEEEQLRTYFDPTGRGRDPRDAADRREEQDREWRELFGSNQERDW